MTLKTPHVRTLGRACEGPASREETVAELRQAILARLTYTIGKDPAEASSRDWFIATALAVRDRIVERWIETTRANVAGNKRRVYYLSLEFLIGRLLMDSLNNLGITDEMRTALAGLDVDLDALREIEPDAALGNGGLEGWRPVLWKAWRRFRLPPTATASATIMACSARRSRMAGSSNARRTGWNSATRGSSRGPTLVTRSALGAW